MKTLRIILGDQLSLTVAALQGIDRDTDTVLMMEVVGECTSVKHHKQKIILILSTMRHFAQSLRDDGIDVDYIMLDAPDNTGAFSSEVQRAIKRHAPQRLVVTAPSEWRVLQQIETWQDLFGLPVDILEDDRFFATPQRFATWAQGKRVWRMEYFYREMRVEHNVLVEGGKPVGGAWNFDAENRKSLPAQIFLPARKRFPPDAVTHAVIALVDRLFPDHIGVAQSFAWPVTRAQALEALDDFITQALPDFGDYQDAMKTGNSFLYHSLLAPALNIGLLVPREICLAAQQAYQSGHAPLNAVEGFIRQILGWREYVRGIYWAKMPDYANQNALQAHRTLPAFYWSGETSMNCLREAVQSTIHYAYAHHIQRLMVTGNFALLAGVVPHEIERWYLAVYADAFEWVEMPNTLGMAVFADGGQMASKPYAASGAYINKMSDYCAGCAYDVKQKTGAAACPFNYLYWAFLIRNKQSLSRNPRLAMPYRTLAGWSAERQTQILAEAEAFLEKTA